MNIGISGGNTLADLGAAGDVHKFFNDLTNFHTDRIMDNKTLEKTTRRINRLYKKYVKEEDLLDTLDLVFMFVKSAILDKKFIFSNTNIKLGLKIVDTFNSAVYCIRDWKHYNFPVSLIVIDAPYWIFRIGDNIPLSDVDNLEGDPLWMRPEYMLEKYG